MADTTNSLTNAVTNAVTNSVTTATNTTPSNGLLKDFTNHPLLDPATTLGAVIDGVIIAVIAWLLGRLLAYGINRLLNRHKHIPADPTAIRFLGHLGRAGVYVFAFITYAQLVPALQSMGHAWLASVGLVSVVIGLAAQSTLGNLIAGVSLLLYRPFNIGDFIQVATPAGLESGTVENLDLGYTVLRTPDNRRILIPNNVMANQTSINLSIGRNRLLSVIPINVGPETDLERARAALVDIVKQYPKAREFVGAPVTAISNTSITLTLKVWCETYSDINELKSDLLEAIRKRFKAEGIELR